MTRIHAMVLAVVCAASAMVVSADELQVAGKLDIVQDERLKQLRDPFWPIGHQRVTESEQAERSKIAELKSRISWPSIPLRGIIHAGGKRFIAVIEGAGLVESGDIVTIQSNALTYRWRIDNVTSEGVASTRLDVTETVVKNSGVMK